MRCETYLLSNPSAGWLIKATNSLQKKECKTQLASECFFMLMQFITHTVLQPLNVSG